MYPSYHYSGFKYGAPYNDELYLHRLGRTGRAGKQGSGLLVLLPFETSLKSKLRRRNVVEGSGVAAFVNEISPAIEKKVNSVKQLVRSGHTVLTPCAETACKSFVAHYLEYAGDWVSGPALLDTASTLAEAFGLVGFSPFPDDLHARLQNNKL